MYWVKSLLTIHKMNIERRLLLIYLLQDIARNENLLRCTLPGLYPPPRSKSGFAFI